MNQRFTGIMVVVTMFLTVLLLVLYFTTKTKFVQGADGSLYGKKVLKMKKGEKDEVDEALDEKEEPGHRG